jgi:hypothetical protein
MAFWIFVATRSGANLSAHPRMLASVPKIKNGAYYQPQLHCRARGLQIIATGASSGCGSGSDRRRNASDRSRRTDDF